MEEVERMGCRLFVRLIEFDVMPQSVGEQDEVFLRTSDVIIKGTIDKAVKRWAKNQGPDEIEKEREVCICGGIRKDQI